MNETQAAIGAARVGPDAINSFLFQEGSWITFCVMLAAGVVLALRERRLPNLLLLLIAGTSMWWQETYGDWGCYLLYSPDFALIPGWGHLSYQSPNQPWALIPAYGWFYAAYFTLVAAAGGAVHRRWFPRHSLMRVTAIVGTLIWYVYDIVIEGVATRMGWWDYTAAIGPVWTSARGDFPLVYPIIEQIPFMIVVPCLLLARDALGRPLLDKPFAGLAAGWQRESVRLLSWIIAFNVGFGLFLILPLVLIRAAFGPASALVP